LTWLARYFQTTCHPSGFEAETTMRATWYRSRAARLSASLISGHRSRRSVTSAGSGSTASASPSVASASS